MQYIHNVGTNISLYTYLRHGLWDWQCAHMAVDAVMGPHTIQHETVVSEAAPSATPVGNSVASDSCDNRSKAFQDVCSPHMFHTFL
jgi:hypothetical protein